MDRFYDKKIIKFLFKDKILYFKFQTTKKITFCLSLYCFVVGLILWIIFKNPVSYEFRYDDKCNYKQVCNFNIFLNKKIPGPAFIYLRLENFFINHRIIVNSFSSNQLQGQDITIENAKSDCGEYYNNKNGEKEFSIDGTKLNPGDIMNPCGLKPFLYFKDNYKIKNNNNTLKIITTNLINQNYRDYKYTNNPNKNKIQWINYHDEFFVQWMLTPTFKNFEKLYGKLENGLEIGNYNLEIESLSKPILKSVRKIIVIKNLTFLGGKNLNLVYAHMVTSAVLFMSGLILIIYEHNTKHF